MDKMVGPEMIFMGMCVAGCFAVLLATHNPGCTPQARTEADAIAIGLTGAVCSPADPLDASPIVEVICVLAEGAEAYVGAPGSAPPSVGSSPAQSVHLRVRREHLPRVVRNATPDSGPDTSQQ